MDMVWRASFWEFEWAGERKKWMKEMKEGIMANMRSITDHPKIMTKTIAFQMKNDTSNLEKCYIEAKRKGNKKSE